ncbi:MAG: hypothetical protein WDO17_10115 [Alphaproteobacteria bacterium]
MSIVRLTTGNDQFSGQPGENNVFLATPDALQAVDTIAGIQTSAFYDVLALTSAGTVTAGQFAGVSAIEVLLLSDGGNTVTLSNSLVAGTSWNVFAVVAGAGNDQVDASGVTNGTRIACYAGSGTDSFAGGNGNDYFEFSAADLIADTVVGGAGFDCLAFSTGGVVAATAFANVSGIEALLFSNAGNAVTLSNAFLAGIGVMSVVGGVGNDTLDASGVTNGTRVAFSAMSGNDTFTGGNGSDYLSFAADQLTSADHITGGSNFDIIEFSTAGALSATAFNNVTGVDELIFNNGGNSLTLTDAMVAGTDNGVLVVLDGVGDDTVDASVVASTRVVFAATSGIDSFTGGGGSDVALFSATGLTSADGFAGGTGFDVIELTTAGTVAASAFANFTEVDELFLTFGGNNITLNGGMVANSEGGVFVVYDQGGTNTVDAGTATLGGRVVFNAINSDHKTYTGGTGSDFFQFGAANLNTTDTLVGGNGAGIDFVEMTTNGTVTAADLANVTQMEVVQLDAGGSVSLANTLSNSGSLEVEGTGAVDTIDGSAVKDYNIVIKGSGGADTLKGGGGDDQIFLPDTNFVEIDGNGGLDKIVLTSAFNSGFAAPNDQTFDLTALVSKITDVEAISLESAEGATLKVAPSDISQVNSTTNLLYVLGGSDDEVIISGEGWTQLETNHANPAVSSSHIFVHYHNSNGSDLYVDNLIPFTVALGNEFWFS